MNSTENNSLDTLEIDPVALDPCIVRRLDGVFVDPTVPRSAIQMAIERLFASNLFLFGIDYPMFIKTLYGPELPRPGESLIHIAADVLSFNLNRRPLYRSIKINDGQAEYYFEPVFLSDPMNPDDRKPTNLNFDEFVADLWLKGVHFGINEMVVRAAIRSGKNQRTIIAQRLEVTPGTKATIVEVSQDIHRSNTPRQLAGGGVDLREFQNRFPQVKKGVRLLKKVPCVLGKSGIELSGMSIDPLIPMDVDFKQMAGAGTAIENTTEGDFLVALQSGFLSVENKTNRISIINKIINREGVSSRTTGNLRLAGDYEEFGEVQEKRLIEGNSITVHADVFGKLFSREGTIQLHHNMIGGSAHNANGAIRINGIASDSVLQTKKGEIEIKRAESCLISGTRVLIERAINCDIMADEIIIKHAEGCSLAGRKVTIDVAGPRKQNEMFIFVLIPNTIKIDSQIEEINARIDQLSEKIIACQNRLDMFANQPNARNYMVLATKIRNREFTLALDQIPRFKKMEQALGPALHTISRLWLNIEKFETEKLKELNMMGKLAQQKKSSVGVGSVNVRMFSGNTSVHTMKFDLDSENIYDLPPKDIKMKLHSGSAGGILIFSGSQRTLEWYDSKEQA